MLRERRRSSKKSAPEKSKLKQTEATVTKPRKPSIPTFQNVKSKPITVEKSPTKTQKVPKIKNEIFEVSESIFG